MIRSSRSSFYVSAATALSVGLICASASGQGFMAAGSTGATNHTAKTATSAPAATSGMPAVHAFSTDISNGVMTVDGMVAKVGLNYSIHNGFMYFTVPGVGTAIVAQTRFMNAAPQQNAFHGNTLTISVNGHTVELTSNNALIGGQKTAEAWVAVDPLYGAGQYPHMGFGDQMSRPYVWPGSKAVEAKTEGKKGAVVANIVPPPVPVNLRPKPEVASSYSVAVPAAGK